MRINSRGTALHFSTIDQMFLLNGNYKRTKVLTTLSAGGLGVSALTPITQYFTEQWAETLLGVLKTRIEETN